jgi:hypothetical protein
MKASIFVILIMVSSSASAALSEPEFLATIQRFETDSTVLARKFFPRQEFIPVKPLWAAELKDYPSGAMPTRGRREEAEITIAGWVARLPSANSDAIDFVFCHEVGHHVSRRLPTERTADDFAARECLPLLWGTGLTAKRIKAIADYSWDLRTYHRSQGGANRPYDSSRCTVELIVRAGKGEVVTTEEMTTCDRGLGR